MDKEELTVKIQYDEDEIILIQGSTESQVETESFLLTVLAILGTLWVIPILAGVLVLFGRYYMDWW